MSDYSIHASEKHYNRFEGVLYSKLFDMSVPFEAKDCEECFAVRCADFFEKLDLNNSTLCELIDAGIIYLEDLLDDRGDEFDLGEDIDEITREDFLRITAPELIVFELHDLLTEDDCPVGFSIKMHLRAVPDEIFELAMQEERAIYAGEYNGVSPWNEKLLKKKWNYINEL